MKLNKTSVVQTSRRNFLGQIGFISMGFALIACSPASHSATPIVRDPREGLDGECLDDLKTAYLNPGHRHDSISLSRAHVEAAIPGDYELLTGRHNHTFRLTTEDFVKLQNGESIEKVDLEEDGHIVRIGC